ncbi:MAG TPA: hypothetical protein VMX13_01995 [Sedimentisphaerales bacterium]|nr:hypothetical protein [Sedimentisphaerales bacterium]
MTKLTFRESAGHIQKARSIYSALRRTRPQTKQDLKNYVKAFLGIDIPDRKICPEHSSPMDYLWHSFSADFAPHRAANADAVVWANRAGGKTRLAAVATLLDCIFKPNCQVRILGGSGEQSGRMYEYLTTFLHHGFEEFLAGPVRKEKCRFINGATVEVLTQSPMSVRGQHIQKLRCDEVELFDEDVFAAAKFTTHSTAGLVGAMEVISTMHRPYGLMQKVVSSADHLGAPLFKWCLWEVIEKCTDRNCSPCPLWPDCQSKAKQGAGYLRIDDAITAMRRASRAGWEAEMLCRKPNLENTVFAEFDPDLHVRTLDYDPDLPTYRSLDFGFVNPFVCLWIQVDDNGTVRVIDEYVRCRATIDVHAAEIRQRTPSGESRVAATFCDPAGRSVNDVTGTSTIRELRSLGIVTQYRRSSILQGIELIRRAIRAGDGKSRLLISPRCQRLIEAMQCYHYPEIGSAATELPLKDGLYDHPIDALRYFFVNHNRPRQAAARRY